MRYLYFLILLLASKLSATQGLATGMNEAAKDALGTTGRMGFGVNYDPIYGVNSILAINSSYKFRDIFTYLQGNCIVSYTLVLGVIVILIALTLHYKIIGGKEFHGGEQLEVYTKIDRIVHWCTAIPFLLLILSGFIIIALKLFGYGVGGALPRTLLKAHSLIAIVATPFIAIMCVNWLRFALPKLYDITWFMMAGGYLSKDKGEIIVAGKFNAGQKSWYYIATFGGLGLAFSGYNLYFLDGNIQWLRVMVSLHLTLGIIASGFIIVHVYMSTFIVKGLHTMIDGKMPVDEIRHMHNAFYKDLINEGRLTKDGKVVGDGLIKYPCSSLSAQLGANKAASASEPS